MQEPPEASVKDETEEDLDPEQEESEVHPKRQRVKAMDIVDQSPTDEYDETSGASGAVEEAEAAAGALAAAAAGSVLEAAGEEPVIVRLRGLPWSFGVAQVCEFLEGVSLKVQPEAVMMMHNAAGEAFVALETQPQVAEVMQLNKKQVGKRYVEVFESSATEREAACERNLATAKEDAGYRGVLRMRGLPYNTGVDEVLQFFGSPITLKAENVHLLRRADGRASGDAYVVFDTEEAALEGLQLDKQKLGTRWVDLFQSSKGELYSLTSQGGIMISSAAQGGISSSEQAHAVPPAQALGDGFSVVKLRGLPWSATEEDIVTFLSPIIVPTGGVHLMNGANGRPSGLAYVELSSEEEQNEALAKDKQSIGGRYIDIFACSQTELQARLAGGLERPFGGGGGGFGSHAANGGDEGSFFVKLRGLPYAATEQQIVTFFQPLTVVAVQIAFNAQGQPSGFGFVQFRTAEDATGALARSNQVLGSRYVEIFRCSRGDMEQAHMQAASMAPMMRSPYMPMQQQRTRPEGAQRTENAYSAYQAAMQTLQTRSAAVTPYPPYAGGCYGGSAAGYSSYNPANAYAAGASAAPPPGAGFQGADAYGGATHQPASASAGSAGYDAVVPPPVYGAEYSQAAYQQQYWGGY